jgi:uncharacterized protein with von Willebrand factor type A (vWA) domain
MASMHLRNSAPEAEPKAGFHLPPRESRWLYASPHDTFVWERARRSSARLEDLALEVGPKIPTAESLMMDLFCAFYRYDVQWEPVNATDPTVEVDRAILDRVLTSPSYHRLHPGIAGDDEDAIMVLDAFTRAFAASLDPEVVEFLGAEMSFHNEKQQLESEASTLQELIEGKVRPRRREPSEQPTPETMNVAERRARLAELASEIEELEHAHHTNSKVRRARAELRQHLDDADVPGTLEEIARSLDDFHRAMAVWGSEDGPEDDLPLEDRLELFRLFLSDPRLRRVTDLLGRTRFNASGTHSTLTRAAPVQISGLALGDDLTALVPTEAVWLTDADTEREFYRRYAEHELLVRTYEMKGEPSRGPVVVLIDESSSMDGERELMAKAIGLAIISIARFDGRNAALIEFSSHGQQRTTHFEPGEANLEGVVGLLTHFYGGGTDFDAPILAALKLTGTGSIRDQSGDERYRQADVIIISDGEAPLEAMTIELIKRHREDGVRLFAICVGVDDKTFRDVATRTWPLADLLAEEKDPARVPALVEAIH